MKDKLSNFSKVVTLLLLIGCAAVSAHAQESLDFGEKAGSTSPYMFGDWSGARARVANKGVAFDFSSMNDLLIDTHRELANWSRIRGTVDIDFEKADLVRGLTFHITALWQAGGNLGGYIGSIANPSSLVSSATIRLDSWWFEQALAGNRLFIRAGQIGAQDFYGVQQDGSSFILEPLGYALGNLFSADYEGFDPAGTPAVEVRYFPSRHFYVKSAIFSGNRNPYRDDINGLHFKFKDAPLIASEAGVLINSKPSATKKTYPGSYALGATTNPGHFSNLATGQGSRTNYLVYFMANQRIYRPQAGSDRGLDFNFAFDWTPEDMTENFSQLTGGLRYHGVLPGRGQDTLSAGFVYSRVSGVLNRSLSQAGLVPYGTEKAVEVNYAVRVARWFTFQPVFEYYFDTGASPYHRNSVVAGFRTKFVL